MKTKTILWATALAVAASGNGFGQPIITTQPANQTNVLGATATFSVVATGAPPLGYQWRSYAGTTVFTNIPGATEASLVLTNVRFTNAGNYTVAVTNVAGAVTSQVATLTVLSVLFTKITKGPVVNDGCGIARRGHLLDGPSAEYPEVNPFLRK